MSRPPGKGRPSLECEGVRASLSAWLALPLCLSLAACGVSADPQSAPLPVRSRPPTRLAFACQRPGPGRGLACREVDAAEQLAAGRLQGGAIDLTGDGVPEWVLLEGSQVVVHSQAVETWRGLPEWEVVDLALGDPNDDGRGEMLLALWKSDAEGVLRSHPFIVGYRGGTYRVLWGGSAVAAPIREVELGDVDADGVEELVVIEEGDAGGRGGHVTIWRWHGWGFSLLWRSDSGQYRDLALLSNTAQAGDLISVYREP